MKNQLIILFLILSPILTLAQSVNEKPFSEIQSKHLIIKQCPPQFKKGFRIAVDYGQPKKSNFIRKEVLKDEKGEKIRFFSMVEVMNYFDDLGYELVTIYSEVFDDDDETVSSQSYVFRKKE